GRPPSVPVRMSTERRLPAGRSRGLVARAGTMPAQPAARMAALLRQPESVHFARSKMRLFIATSFAPEILRSLNERVTSLKPKLPRASWVRPETQHLTFAFLGEQDESLVSRLQIQCGKSFEASLRGCGFFPNRRHARVGWVGAEPAEGFVMLAGRVRSAVSAAGVEIDQNEFRPHLTLMRIRDHWPPLAIDTFENALRDYRSAPFAIDEITLYVSRLSPGGAVHTPLRQFPLGLPA
ncbi:MAG: RNA 2',3'-cyclic phosphodiesterase, partial [Acidobacteriota bacterium]|nr:RNA 2',3'-cyclic phosphodiesterase [Acidobacteriota bacterium]